MQNIYNNYSSRNDDDDGALPYFFFNRLKFYLLRIIFENGLYYKQGSEKLNDI